MSRLTDYGIVLMSYLASHPGGQWSAAEVALGSNLPPPTVSKLLRILSREGLLESHRGVKGGYALARPADQISVAEIIESLEGPIALTTCIEDAPGECENESVCPVRAPWQLINGTIRSALDGVHLSDLTARSFSARRVEARV